MLKRLNTLAIILLVLAGGYLSFRWVRSQVAAEYYRERLESLRADHQKLRDRYDEAVRRTAVTELHVRNGALSVVMVSLDGSMQQIATDFDPEHEIYVDYIVADGRLWIRRVFDEYTPPGEGLVIDPAWSSVDWSAPGVRYGKSVHRQLTEGRWVVTVTGDGSLGLAMRDDDEPADLAPAPPVRDYEPLESRADARRGGLESQVVASGLVQP